MATSRRWPILLEMEKTGAYSSVLWSYADALPSGTWYGRPIEGDVNGGLGCSDVGVDLPPGPNDQNATPPPK